MGKRVSDLLATGLLGIGVWVLTNLTNTLEGVGFWFGLIGSIFLIISQVYYLYNTWFRK